MGLFDSIKSTVITEYKADTKDMRAGLKKLSGEEAKRHKALIEQTEAQNKKLDGQIAMWGKVAAGVGGAVVAYQVLSAGLKVYQHNSKLAAATVGVDLSGLQKATNGLVEETRLLEFASKAMNGTFKLSQGEMEQALQGAVALRKTLGVDLADAMKAMQKAITEGTTEPLKELGLVIKGPENDTKEGLQAALEALNGEAKSLGGNFDVAGDGVAKAQVQIADGVDKIMESLGRLAAKLAPVIAGFADLVGYAADLAGIEGSKGVGDLQAGLIDARKAIENDRVNGPYAGLKRAGDERIGLARLRMRGIKVGSMAELEEMIVRMQRTGAEYGPSEDLMGSLPAGLGAGTGAKSKGGSTKGSPVSIWDFINKQGGPKGIDAAGIAGSLIGSLVGGASGMVGRATETAENDNRLAAAAANAKELADQAERTAAIAAQHAEEDSILSNLFGTPSEIDAQTAALQALASTFDGFAGAFGAGVDALITGSSSFADAFKNAIGESLRAMAVEMSISALKHTAYGLASLAFLDGRGAAAHFAAAGTFAAGAVAAGGGARLLGAGQSQGATAPRTAGTAGVGTSGGASNDNGDRGSTQVFIVGNDFAGLPARQRESQWRQISRSAGVSIDGDVVVNG